MSSTAWTHQIAVARRQRGRVSSSLGWALGAALLGIAVGVAAATSALVAAALLAPLALLLVGELPVSLVFGGILTLRILLDERSGIAGQQSTSINPSGLIALLMLAMAAGALYRHRQGSRFAVAGGAALVVLAAIAVVELGLSSAVLREPLRESSLLAVGLIALNFRELSVASATRIIQVAGAAAAALAVYQGMTGGGLTIAGTVRANGTFSHPNSAALYFGIASVASIWRFFELRRRVAEVAFMLLYVAGAVFTFSLGGMATLVTMLLAYGALRHGSLAPRLLAWLATAVIAFVFLATPLGSSRLAAESSAGFGTTYSSTQSSNSLNWRIYNWRTLIPVWEKSPIVGEGLGATVLGKTPTGVAPHNEYIRYLVETGLVGVGAIAFGLWMLLRGLKRVARLPASVGSGALGLALVVGLMVNALVANTLLYTPAAYAAVFVVSAVVGRADAVETEGENPL